MKSGSYISRIDSYTIIQSVQMNDTERPLTDQAPGSSSIDGCQAAFTIQPSSKKATVMTPTSKLMRNPERESRNEDPNKLPHLSMSADKAIMSSGRVLALTSASLSLLGAVNPSPSALGYVPAFGSDISRTCTPQRTYTPISFAWQHAPLESGMLTSHPASEPGTPRACTPQEA